MKDYSKTQSLESSAALLEKDSFESSADLLEKNSLESEQKSDFEEYDFSNEDIYEDSPINEKVVLLERKNGFRMGFSIPLKIFQRRLSIGIILFLTP